MAILGGRWNLGTAFFRLGPIVVLATLSSCSYYRGSGDARPCADMHLESAEVRSLSDQVSKLEKENLVLSKNSESNYEEIVVNQSRISERRKRIEELDKNIQRQSINCRPMFEDPETKRAEEQGYQEN